MEKQWREPTKAWIMQLFIDAFEAATLSEDEIKNLVNEGWIFHFYPLSDNERVIMFRKNIKTGTTKKIIIPKSDATTFKTLYEKYFSELPNL